MHTQFKSLHKTIEKIIGEISEKDEERLYQRYYRLLQHCLPENWQNSVLLTNIADGIWWLGVKNRQEAYLLQFLIPDIQARLREHLRQVPTLKIKADPEYWVANQQQQICVVRSSKRHYSDEEIETILQKLIYKPNSSSTK